MKHTVQSQKGKLKAATWTGIVLIVCFIVWGKQERGEVSSLFSFDFTSNGNAALPERVPITIYDSQWSDVKIVDPGEVPDCNTDRDDLWHVTAVRLRRSHEWKEYEVPPWSEWKERGWSAPTKYDYDAIKWKLSDKNRGVHEATFRYRMLQR